MNDESREELLSAYLDNELSAAQRARVEQWLADDAEYRRLHEELTSLRAELRSLPRHQLGEDLAPAVVRRAEQQVLEGESSAKVGLSDRAAAAEWWSRRSRRIFLWPAVAVAAALLVALFNTQHNPREVAREDSTLRRVSTDNGRMEIAADERDAAAGTPEPTALRSAGSGEALRKVPALKAANGTTAMPADAPVQGKVAADDASAGPPAPRSAAQEPANRAAELREGAPAAMPARKGIPGEGDFYFGAKVETNVQRALENREQVNLIQADVTPAFLKDNSLEQVLAGNEISFQCYAIPQADTKSNRAIRSQRELESSEDLGYAVEATPEQVEVIVKGLAAEQNRQRVSNLVIGLQEQPVDQAQPFVLKVPEGQKAQLGRRQAQQALTIYLRKQAGPQTAPLQQAAPPTPAEP